MLGSREEQNKNIKSPADPTADPPAAKTVRVRELNDLLRTSGRGGIIMITNGLGALGRDTVTAVFAAITGFTAFDTDNDPWGEHDCAVMTVDGHRVIWKIDYYDRSRRIHSPDPADPKVTVRVLTVMLAEEY